MGTSPTYQSAALLLSKRATANLLVGPRAALFGIDAQARSEHLRLSGCVAQSGAIGRTARHARVCGVEYSGIDEDALSMGRPSRSAEDRQNRSGRRRQVLARMPARRLHL